MCQVDGVKAVWYEIENGEILPRQQIAAVIVEHGRDPMIVYRAVQGRVHELAQQSVEVDSSIWVW